MLKPLLSQDAVCRHTVRVAPDPYGTALEVSEDLEVAVRDAASQILSGQAEVRIEELLTT